jgi:uncharacterized membrane protein (UPF0127 family)
MVEIIDAATGEALLGPVKVVGTLSPRSARGLLGRHRLAPGAGLLLADPLRCVHTIGMRFPIDVVFLDRDLRVVHVAPAVPPGRLCWHRRGRLQLELAAGTAQARGLVPGRRLRLRKQGGHIHAESPQVVHSAGESAHTSAAGHCGAAGDLPRLPAPAGSAGVDRTANERSTPCAHIS